VNDGISNYKTAKPSKEQKKINVRFAIFIMDNGLLPLKESFGGVNVLNLKTVYTQPQRKPVSMKSRHKTTTIYTEQLAKHKDG
jgi:hypothetical protein